MALLLWLLPVALLRLVVVPPMVVLVLGLAAADAAASSHLALAVLQLALWKRLQVRHLVLVVLLLHGMLLQLLRLVQSAAAMSVAAGELVVAAAGVAVATGSVAWAAPLTASAAAANVALAAAHDERCICDRNRARRIVCAPALVHAGAVAVVDLVGFKKNADGSKGEKLPDLAIGENVEVVMEAGKFFEGFVESIEVRSVGWGRAGVKTLSSGEQARTKP